MPTASSARRPMSFAQRAVFALSLMLWLVPAAHSFAETDNGNIMSSQVTYHTVYVNGIKIFYREAGDPKNPTILLLHGFPASSHMYASHDGLHREDRPAALHYFTCRTSAARWASASPRSILTGSTA